MRNPPLKYHISRRGIHIPPSNQPGLPPQCAPPHLIPTPPPRGHNNHHTRCTSTPNLPVGELPYSGAITAKSIHMSSSSYTTCSQSTYIIQTHNIHNNWHRTYHNTPQHLHNPYKHKTSSIHKFKLNNKVIKTLHESKSKENQ